MSYPSHAFARPLSPALSQSSDTTVDDLPRESDARLRTSDIRTDSEERSQPSQVPIDPSRTLLTPASVHSPLPLTPSTSHSSNANPYPQEESQQTQLATPPADVASLPSTSDSASFDLLNLLAHVAENSPPVPTRRVDLIRAFRILVTAAGYAQYTEEIEQAAPHPRVDRNAAEPPKRGRKRKPVEEGEEDPAISSNRPAKSRRVATSAKKSNTRGRPSKVNKSSAANEVPVVAASPSVEPKVSKPRNRFVNPRPSERMTTRSAKNTA
ncbi:hypothetical protein SCHPADRAFT_66101 [Schizopora paradoxa]|uniref:Uncharacterized protein n=1 Tax=Schizopora paradoxa TaxID=27342 RepID=A0A0H2S5P4_9AGAM|nr:hypothetical protein SCHPADRAFT_66101 [Schizopora paradoxa]